jgi:hypothetical protein
MFLRTQPVLSFIGNDFRKKYERWAEEIIAKRELSQQEAEFQHRRMIFASAGTAGSACIFNLLDIG